jgi:transcriptional regulator with XRE-family HTH domain
MAQGAFYVALGARLSDARRRARITQDQLARAIGLSRTSITNIEKGRQPVQVHLLLRIAVAIGLPAVRLLSSSANRLASKRLTRTPNVRPGTRKSAVGPK